MNILLIDDEPLVRKTMRVALERAGHQVVEAANGRIGGDLFDRGDFDLVISDILMPEQEGIETIRKMRSARPDVRILAISGGGRGKSTGYLWMAADLGANEVLQKPFGPTELVAMVSHLCAHDTAP